MAMIICPICGKEFSDKAAACPQCGYVSEKKEEVALISCEECGNEFDSKLDACPNCGCPKAETKSGENIQKTEGTKTVVNRNKVIIGLVIAIAIMVVVIVGILVKKNNNQKEYYSNLESATMLMLSGCADAESSAGLIHDVWKNAIYEDRDDETDKYTRPDGYFVSDFNDALSNLWSDTSFLSDIEEIKNNQESVQKIMKNLKNPPDKYAEAYSDLKAFYDVYLEFTNLAINPSGNLTSYTEDYNDLDSDVMSKYDKMKMHLEE